MVSVQSEYIMSADVSDEIQKPQRDDPFLLNIKKRTFIDVISFLYAFAHCLKITQNVAFVFLNFGIFHQFLSY